MYDSTPYSALLTLSSFPKALHYASNPVLKHTHLTITAGGCVPDIYSSATVQGAIINIHGESLFENVFNSIMSLELLGHVVIIH